MAEENNNGGGKVYPDMKSGTQIDHYRIVDKIGAGGMGDLYLAEDLRLNRKVVIKFLASIESSVEADRQRFLDEAKAAAAINHPNIVTIYDTGLYKNSPYIVMEYVSGRSLEDIINTGPVKEQQTIEIAVQVCSGLAEIHKHNIIHCDVKPSNIILDDMGRVRLLDFGIARLIESKNKMGDILSGSVYYISPEQANNESLTPATDLFSLGILLYQMAAGRLPFEGEYEAQVIYSIVNEQPPPVESLNSRISREFIHVINKLLEKNPEQRYASAEDLWKVLIELKKSQSPIRKEDSLALRRRLPFYVGLGIIVIIILLTLYNLIIPKLTVRTSGRKMIAVLPFDNLGPAEDEYLTMGITDEIIAKLATVDDLGVISRTSVMRYKDHRVSLRDIGQELGVEYILEGTVKWSRVGDSDRIRITPQLIRVADDTHLWVETYDHTLTDIFNIQTKIAEDVTRSLHVTLSKTEANALQSRPTNNLGAYNFYLKGNDYFNRSWNCDDIAIAIDMYQKAVDLDAEFSLAYAMLSRGHESYLWERCDVSYDRRQAARNTAIRALELNPLLAEAHLALGYIYYHCDLNYEKALNKFQDVLEHQPSHSTALTAVATVQRRIGPLEEAVSNFRKSLELDPLSHLKAFDVGLTYGMLRDYSSAEIFLERALSLAPDWELPYIYKAWLKIFDNGNTAAAARILDEANRKTDLSSSQYYWWLARIVTSDYEHILETTGPGRDTAAYWLHAAQLCRLLNKPEEEYAYADSARRHLGQFGNRMSENPVYLSHLGLAYAGTRNKDSAVYYAQKAVELLPASRDAFDALFLLVNLAEVLVIFEEYDSAVSHLEYLLTIPGFVSTPYLKADPLWEPLKDHPGFMQLIEAGA